MNNMNNNQNMSNMNNMNNNKQNMNNMNNNINQSMNFQRKVHRPQSNESVVCSVQQESSVIDKNETNEIKNIVQVYYSSSLAQNNIILSDYISEEIKKKLNGEWFVFVSDDKNNIDFSISTNSESDFLKIKIGSSLFTIAKIK